MNVLKPGPGRVAGRGAAGVFPAWEASEGWARSPRPPLLPPKQDGKAVAGGGRGAGKEARLGQAAPGECLSAQRLCLHRRFT